MGLWTVYKAKKAAERALDKFQMAVENGRRRAAGQEVVLTRRERIARRLSPFYPPFKKQMDERRLYDRMFIAGTRANALFRLIRNIVLLETFGIVMYLVMALQYSHDPGKTGTFVSVVVHFFLSLMFVFPSVMYYFMLATHRMMASKLRTLLLLILISIAFEGPAMNALTNVHRVAEGVACVQNDVMNAARQVDENVAKHGQFGVDLMQSLVAKLAKPINFFKRQMQKFDTKVSRVIETIKQTWKHLSDLTNKCKKMMRGPYLVCLNSFHSAFVTCSKNERFLGTDVCSSIQRANKICEMGMSVGDSVCNFPSKVKGGILEGAIPFYKKFWGKVLKTVKGASYFHVKAFKWGVSKGKRVKQEFKNLKTLGLKVSMGGGKESKLKQLKENFKKTLTSIMDTYKKAMKVISAVLHWTLIPLALLWPFFSTALFTYKFNYREDYKNVYLTEDFDKIDLDCALKGRTKALPLNNDEKQLYTRRMAWRMTALERRDYLRTVAMTVLAAATPLIFVVMDVVIYLIIYGVYEVFSRTKIEFPAHYELKIAGDGFGSRMMNTLLETFSPITNGLKERDQKWRECFSEPNPPDYALYTLMLFLFVLCLVLCRTKVWLARQSLALADYFFPHRVRPRALMLYNKILCDRKSLMGFMMGRKRAILADDQLAGRESLVRRGMQSRGFVRVNCCRCDKTDLRLADEANTRVCVTCSAFYCIECFSMNQFCNDCENDMQVIDGIELYFEKLSDDEESASDGEEEEEGVEEGGAGEPQQPEIPALVAVPTAPTQTSATL